VNEPLSQHTFDIILTMLVVCVCAPWLIYEIRNLSRALKQDGSDPVVRDRRFGYSIGILIAVVGIYGSLKYNGVL